jgi:hypothetical protein
MYNIIGPACNIKHIMLRKNMMCNNFEIMLKKIRIVNLGITTNK